jgi:hypothetical protein
LAEGFTISVNVPFFCETKNGESDERRVSMAATNASPPGFLKPVAHWIHGVNALPGQASSKSHAAMAPLSLLRDVWLSRSVVRRAERFRFYDPLRATVFFCIDWRPCSCFLLLLILLYVVSFHTKGL